MPDPRTSRILFSSGFTKKAWAILCKTDPDPIWVAWPGFGHTHLVWKQAGVQESSGPVSGRTRPVRCYFPTFRLGSVLPQMSRIISCKTSPDPIQFWLIVPGLGQRDPVRKQAKGIRSGSKPVCRNHPARFWPVLPGRSGPDANRIRHVYWGVTTASPSPAKHGLMPLSSSAVKYSLTLSTFLSSFLFWG